MVRAVASGDFYHSFRIYVTVDAIDVGTTITDTIDYGVAFIDGDSAADDSWYGLMFELGGAAVMLTEPAVYEMSKTSGSGRWDATPSYALVLGSSFHSSQAWDVWMVRSGTTLTAYYAPPGGAPVRAKQWTVTSGAGYIGLRYQLYTASADRAYIVGCTLHDGAAAATLPWQE
jgi:hypothetical protein